MRILFDNNIPRGLRRLLCDHEVSISADLGWEELANGTLLALAEQTGFDVLLTADQGVRYEQNQTSRQIAIVVLGSNLRSVLKARG